ncbi:hypothetical protein [Candidatus Poriferisodalis sp.]|uniref:hypothetical protein n=1 Tax=Candidatus Poriferisodalis sp. TaxID=3101277 RepID=UPI003B0196AD
MRARLASNDGLGEETTFHDVTSPLLAELHDTRLFPNRRYLVPTGIFTLLHHRDEWTYRFEQALLNEGLLTPEEIQEVPNLLEALDEKNSDSTAPAMRYRAKLIDSFAASEVKRLWGNIATHYQLRMVYIEPTPYSQRGMAPLSQTTNIIDSPWIMVESHRRDQE